MPLLLRTLGSPRVESETGDPLPFPEGKPLALLVYLAVEGRPVRRVELARLLWPDSSRERAFQSLRQALWVIRRTVGESVVSGADPVEVTPGALTTDLELDLDLEPDRDRDDPPFPRAFLESFALAGSPAWEEWVEETGSRIRRRRATALHAAAQAAREEGGLQRAVGLARQAILVEPGEVEHHLLLANLLLDRMETERAARALAEARLELEPRDDSGALAALEARVAEQLRARSGVTTLRRPELVGRTSQLATLQAEWRRSSRGEARIVALRGNLGTGRTRLAEELGSWVEAQAGVVVAVRTTESERTLSLGYLSLLVSRLLVRPGGRGVSAASDSLLRSLVPRLHTGPQAPRPTGTLLPSALADAVTDLVGAVAHEHPLLLVLDDLRWADAESRAVLLRVARELRTEAVLILLLLPRGKPWARRDGDLPGLEEMEREGRVRTLLLEKLDLAHTRELLSLHLDLAHHPDPERIVADLHAASGGNPLFLVEILDLLLERGAVVRTPDGWSLPGPVPDLLPLPPTIAAALDLRVGALEGPAAALAALLTRYPGGPGGLDPGAAALLEPSLSNPSTFRAAADELVAVGLARRDEGRLEVSHEGARAALERRFLQPPAGAVDRLRGRSRRVALGALVVATMMAAWAMVLRPSPPASFGGGALWMLLANGETLVVDPPPRPDDPWRPRPAPYPAPTPGAAGPFLLDGGHHWFLDRVTPDRSPWVARWSPGGDEVTILARERTDVNFAGVSPDGSMVAVLSDDPSTPQYDMGLVVVGADGSAPRTILQAPGLMSSGGWSPDGGRILAILPGNPDTVVTLTPTGARMEVLPVGGVEHAAWCGGGDRVLLLTLDPARGPSLVEWALGER